jgi:SAM-dependent methyltransferase
VIEARDRWRHDPRFKFVAADVYALPFVDGVFDAVVMIRVIHHIVDVPRALSNIAASMNGQGVFVFEFANKRNLKSMLRYALRQQKWSPYDRSPIEFAELNFDFHPTWMKTQLHRAGFTIQQIRGVSMFRVSALKGLFGAQRLAAFDSALQRPLAPLAIAPSMFVQCQLPAPSPGEGAGGQGLFRCPLCRQPLPIQSADGVLRCADDHRWSAHDGIYDFKSPL